MSRITTLALLLALLVGCRERGEAVASRGLPAEISHPSRSEEDRRVLRLVARARDEWWMIKRLRKELVRLVEEDAPHAALALELLDFHEARPEPRYPDHRYVGSAAAFYDIGQDPLATWLHKQLEFERLLESFREASGFDQALVEWDSR